MLRVRCRIGAAACISAVGAMVSTFDTLVFCKTRKKFSTENPINASSLLFLSLYSTRTTYRPSETLTPSPRSLIPHPEYRACIMKCSRQSQSASNSSNQKKNPRKSPPSRAMSQQPNDQGIDRLFPQDIGKSSQATEVPSINITHHPTLQSNPPLPT